MDKDTIEYMGISVIESPTEDMVISMCCGCKIKSQKHFQFCPIHSLVFAKIIREMQETKTLTKQGD